MITIKDVKVYHKTSSHTLLQKWETYWFRAGEQHTFFGIIREDGIFKFFAKHCKTLKEAKLYIVEYLNNGGNFQSI